MRQTSTYDKIQAVRPVVPPAFLSRLREICYPVLMALTKAKVRFRVEKLNNWQAEPGKPVIFAANHSAFPDIPIALKAIGQHSYVLLGKQNLTFLDEVFFVLNGVVWVDRKKREDMAAAKQGIADYLADGRSVLWFPEGTWNLTDNLLMLPMKWGVIDVAREADAQIIPVAIEYERKKMVCRVLFGEVMSGEVLENKADAICKLRDKMASLRWLMMEDHPCLSRRGTDLAELKSEIICAVDEYPPLNWEYESSCIFNYPPENVFAYRDAINVERESAFLFNKNLKG